MKGPFYTLSEAQDKLSLAGSELRDLITSKRLTAVVYTKKRAFVALDLGHKGERIGNACFSYRGHLVIARESILTLLDGDSVQLGQGSVSLAIEPDNVTDWQLSYPYKTEPPYDGFSSWVPLSLGQYDTSKLRVIPKPIEGETTQSFVAQMAGSIGRMVADEKSTDEHVIKARNDLKDITSNVRKYGLNYSSNSLVEPDNLRIPASEIQRFKKIALEEPKVEIPRLKRQRTNQLHELIFKVMLANPNAGAKELWNLIQKDCDSDTPLYDLDAIVSIMDSTCIEWNSRKGKPRVLKWTSFEALVSKLRKQSGG